MTSQAGDVALARACAQGDATAAAEVRERLGAEVRKAARRLGAAPEAADEATQVLAEALLVRGGMRRYAGTGPLSSWLRAMAYRTLGRARQRAARETPATEVLEAGLSQAGDVELDFIKASYRRDFALAFRAALAALEPRERNVLKLHLVSGVSIDRLGVMYRVHRATAARWVVAARQKLVDRTRAQLALRLKVPRAEADSLARLLESQLEVSLSRFTA